MTIACHSDRHPELSSRVAERCCFPSLSPLSCVRLDEAKLSSDYENKRICSFSNIRLRKVIKYTLSFVQTTLNGVEWKSVVFAPE